jgi:exopolyphosphatase/guanosine-5'-triphosphate,3'-diphosphate pyrophosphatase
VKVAVVDLGTNSVRLLLASVEAGQVRDVARETTVTRLGAGVDRRRRLDAAAAGRTRACVARYAALIAAFAPDSGLLVATSVLRDAADGTAFLDELAALAGLPARVLRGEEEATLSFAGAVAGTAAWGREEAGRGDGRMPARPAIVVVDIGGGSMELAVGAPATEAATGSLGAAPPTSAAPTSAAPLPAPAFVCSLDVGVVRLTERFFAGDPPTDVEWRAARDFVRATLVAAVPAAVRAPVGRGVGLAGTFTTLVAHKLALRTYDRALVHGHELTLADLTAAEVLFRGMSSAARGRLPGIQKGREDVILAGVLLAGEVCRLCALEAVRVSESDLLDGAALSLAR